MGVKRVSKSNYDFAGYATKNDIECSDGRTIRRNAFAECNGKVVPIVWNHEHDDPSKVLGHALLENREDGVYIYGLFNETSKGKDAKEIVKHGDVASLSIYANKLTQAGANVLHGAIREVSLVLAGANPGAYIDSIIAHGDDIEDAVIFNSEYEFVAHSDEEEETEPTSEENGEGEDELEHAEGQTVEDVLNSMTETQQKVAFWLAEQAAQQALEEKDSDNKDSEGGEEMKHNAFEGDKKETNNVLSHSDIEKIFAEAKRNGSLADAFLAHAVQDENGNNVTYGIANIDYLFNDYQNVTDKPGFIQRDMDWVQEVMNSVHHTPFARIKSVFANITMDEARAKGYFKGNLKEDEVFALLKRTTDPQTVYKKQKLDRDDIIDITSFDVVAWIKAEMRMMLDEEIARAILVGDGRLSGADDKISPDHIRPIWTDSDLYTVKVTVDQTGNTNDNAKANARIRAMIKARKNYKGSGNPVLFTTEDDLTDMLLITDTTGRDIYDSVEKLATKLRVRKIVTVPVMEGLTRVDGAKTLALHGIIVNLKDYNVGADKGGAVGMFDDFDIDYNQYKYLIETRCSGALIKPYAALVIEEEVAAG